jgi:tyrosyl-tRNA synthetase
MSQLTFTEELKWRGMLHDSTPGIEEHLGQGMRTGYIGFDPTAASLTIGNYVQIMILDLFQKAGHQPIILMGGATGRIGDPSGKDSERELKSIDELDRNLRHQEAQFRRLLNFEDGANKAMLLNNFDFYKQMPVLDFLRDVGKHMTINYMLAKDSVQNRLESGMSYTEFSYQVLQAYDYLCLFRDHGCTIQMGGSDQWGNITSGTEFIRKNTTEGKAFAVTTPLLTKADGSKFGKSESGNIWLDPEMTSPYQFYQFWIRADDRDVPRFLRFFSLKSHDEIQHLEAQMETAPRDVKKSLAEEITARVHSPEDLESAAQVSEILFNPKAGQAELHAMSINALRMIVEEIPSFKVAQSVVANGTDILELMAGHTAICASKGEARRAVQSNAVSVNKEKISALDFTLTTEHLLHGKYLLLENGKKNKFIIEVLPA